MATNYPTSLDSLTNPTSSDKVNTVDHAAQHANANDAIEAIQAKVGIDSSAVTTSHDYKLSSHDYKLSGVTGSDKASSVAGTETLTNKTLTSPTINSATLDSPTVTTGITLPTGWTGVLRADSGVVSTDGDVTDIVTAASTSAAGKIEIATAGETTTGTDATRAVTPDGLAGSDYGKRVMGFPVFAPTETATSGDGKAYVRVPSVINGYNLVAVAAQVVTAGTTGTMDIQIHNVTQAADMLTTKITIDSAETDSSTAATAAVIDTANDDVATGDQLRIDIDALHTTPAVGLFIELQFQLP